MVVGPSSFFFPSMWGASFICAPEGTPFLEEADGSIVLCARFSFS